MSILSVSGLEKSFAGFKAVDNVDLELERGEMLGLIGANGAGKSTLLHLIYGRLHPDRGSIRFNGTDVTLLPVIDRARMGMGLVFQIISVFDGLTVDENLLLGALPKGPVPPPTEPSPFPPPASQPPSPAKPVLPPTGGEKASESPLPATPYSHLRGEKPDVDQEAIEKVLDLVDLRAVRGRSAGKLGHGEKQRLEIGMVLLTGPTLLLLDEPTSGMTEAESRHTAGLLQTLRSEGGIAAAIVVEHNIEFIRLVADRVTVMHRGSVLADGPIDKVQDDPSVQASFLGRLH